MAAVNGASSVVLSGDADALDALRETIVAAATAPSGSPWTTPRTPRTSRRSGSGC
ncbi:hypothetical protein ACFQ3Z_04975 [Streptomyces nogalater]